MRKTVLSQQTNTKFTTNSALDNTLRAVKPSARHNTSVDDSGLTKGYYCSSLELCDFERVTQIEPACYSKPWSKTVLYNEFSNQVSHRVALFKKIDGDTSDLLIGYSFNHLVLDELHILNLAIDPEFQGKGLGRELLKATLRTAETNGATRAFLEVRPSNRAANALYRQFGFRRLGIRKHYYRNNGEDAIVMESYLRSCSYLVGAKGKLTVSV